ncbi:amidohydrolase family protein [Arthrobacter sp. MMS18-M83]|uniref:amidohydrolase family protein n=1 Tax=Arthrobacter sp. MMS18-M83 TaxID=2996261 RepID=UPI00227C18F6|nr:amidohydrolase family protein [Arthrobacter sp. MMS18-M83]WAH97577.1 amidohydrolase family protein [Arthrobacter sp. MMS18-M83]
MTTALNPPGRDPIVDCDVHPMARTTEDFYAYLTADWRRHFEERGVRTYARARDRYNHPADTQRLDAYPADGGPAGSDPELVIERHLDPYGITTALLLPQQPYGTTAWGDIDAANAFVNATNDYFVETWINRDPRFGLAITVSPHDPAQAAAEIRRHAGTPGVVAVQLLVMERMLGDSWYNPIYEAAVEAGLPIAVHQSGSEGCYTFSQGPAGGVPRSYGERHSVLTQVGAANVADLIVNGTFEMFPSLKVIFVEWGFSWLPSLMNRLDLFWERDPGAALRIQKKPSEYIREHITFTTQPLDEVETQAELDALFSPAGVSDVLLFSSDYPHYDTDDPFFVLHNKIPERLRRAVCYENALGVFGDKIFRTAVTL